MSANHNYSINASINTGSRVHINRPANNNFPLIEIEGNLIRLLGENILGEGHGYNRDAFQVLSAGQTGAAEKICRGFQLLFEGGHVGSGSLDGDPWSETDLDRGTCCLDEQFIHWAKDVFERGLSMSAALDILMFGKNFRDVDIAASKRAGFAKKNLFEVLDIYLEIQ